MPYVSQAQVGLMHARHPAIAKRWDRKYGVPRGLPKRKGKPKSKAFYDALERERTR